MFMLSVAFFHKWVNYKHIYYAADGRTHGNIGNGAFCHFGHVQWNRLEIIGTHFGIIKDRQLYIFIKTFYMLDIPDNDNGDCEF